MTLWSESVMIALPEKHKLAGSDHVRWVDLINETILLRRYDPAIKELILSKLGACPNIVSHNVGHESMKSLVRAGFGVSLMCEASAGEDDTGIRYREMRDENGSSRLDYAAYWLGENTNPTLIGFVELLRERYANLPGSG